jgi:hypothetical protein
MYTKEGKMEIEDIAEKTQTNNKTLSSIFQRKKNIHFHLKQG